VGKMFYVATKYVGLFVMGRNPYRLIKLNRHSIKLTKELLADIVIHPQIEGEIGMMLKVSEHLETALMVLKHQKGTSSLDQIVDVAHAYTVGKTEGLL
jgi:hypothetical protein